MWYCIPYSPGKSFTTLIHDYKCFEMTSIKFRSPVTYQTHPPTTPTPPPCDQSELDGATIVLVIYREMKIRKAYLVTLSKPVKSSPNPASFSVCSPKFRTQHESGVLCSYKWRFVALSGRGWDEGALGCVMG